MKKMYLSTAVVLSALFIGLEADADSATESSAIGSATTASTASEGKEKSLRKIFLLSIKPAQGALDDATGFLGISPSKRTICFSEQGGSWKSGYVITPRMQVGLAASVCQTINASGGMGQQITDMNSIKVPVATQHFDWRPGNQTNPDEWYTPSGKMPAADVHGVCTTSDSGDIGLAVRGVGKPHQCVLSNRSVPLNDQSILVLVK